MNELIRIEKNSQGEQIVSARELYDFLEYDKSQWSRWSNKNIVNDTFFEENQDYITIDIVSNGNKTKDYIIKMDMAKELSMLARNEKGKRARKYFIECEKKLRQSAPKTLKEALILALEQQEKIEQLEYQNKIQEQEIKTNKPKIDYYNIILADTDSLMTISQIAKDYGLSGKKLNNILHEEKVQYKQNGQWLLYSKYIDAGYVKSVTWQNGNRTGLHTKWVQRGRVFIHNLLEKREIKALMDV